MENLDLFELDLVELNIEEINEIEGGNWINYVVNAVVQGMIWDGIKWAVVTGAENGQGSLWQYR